MAARLNDPRHSRIGNPRTNTWAVSFSSTGVHELAALAAELEALGVEFQTNYARAEDPKREERQRAFLTIYELASQERLLAAIGPLLGGSRFRKLEDLVAARSPVPDDLLRRMAATIEIGKSYEYLADALNRRGVIAGMGGREWTAKKARRALAKARSSDKEPLLREL